MKKIGITLSLVVIAALVFAVFRPQSLRLFRMRMYASGLAWSERACLKSEDCLVVAYRGKACGWVTAKSNHGLAGLEATGRLINEMERAASCDSRPPLVAQCQSQVCVATP